MRFKTIHLLLFFAITQACAENTKLELPGITADRETKQVVIKAKATGLTERENAEFFLINERSGHDYEAIATTPARPGDVHRALEFIGMTPGMPAHTGELRFWPRGERVIVKISSGGKAPAPEPVRAEKLITDTSNGNKTMHETGFVFTGSTTFTNENKEVIYAADEKGPLSIISHYNEICSVMDVPRRASQGAVYGTQIVAPGYAFQKDQPLTITLEPEYKDGRKREVDLTLKTGFNPEKKGLDPADFLYSLTDSSNKTIKKDQPLDEILKSFIEITANGQSPFVTWIIEDDIPLGTVRGIASVLASIESETGIRMNPPPKGQLYFQAFIPDENHRNREDRIVQPWELKLSDKDGKTTGILTLIDQIWKDGVIKPELKLTHYEVATPEQLKNIITGYDKERIREDKRPSIPVILVFTHPTLTHGKLMNFINPARETHGVIHVFLDE